MRTIPCPACSEIIPDNVDYCPHCGESTKQVAESLMTDEDRAVAERMAAIAAANTSGTATTETPPDPSYRAIPEPGSHVCMMCKIVEPMPDHDYCQDCQNKLDLGPEQWQMAKQDAFRKNILTIVLVVLALVAAVMIIVMSTHHSHKSASSKVTPIIKQYASANSGFSSWDRQVSTAQSNIPSQLNVPSVSI
jgi:RNA polymerase subunit RPABC4/transcription elongation factor Spt4